MTDFDCLFYSAKSLQVESILCAHAYGKEKHQILTFEKLELANLWVLQLGKWFKLPAETVNCCSSKSNVGTFHIFVQLCGNIWDYSNVAECLIIQKWVSSWHQAPPCDTCEAKLLLRSLKVKLKESLSGLLFVFAFHWPLFEKRLCSLVLSLRSDHLRRALV